MPYRPLVSVIVPYFKQEEYLLEAVRSVEEQNYDDLELIIVDDCSPGTPARELVRGRVRRNLKVVSHESNQGAPSARNTGASHARGDLILQLDADDLIAPTYLEVTVRRLVEEPELAGVYTAVQSFGEKTGVWLPDLSLPAVLTSSGPVTFLYRRAAYDAVGGYRTDRRWGADTLFLIELLRQGMRLGRVEQPLFYYRAHKEAASKRRTAAEVIGNRLAVYRELFIEHLEEVVSERAIKWARAARDLTELKKQFDILLEHKEQYEKLLVEARKSERRAPCLRKI